MDLLGARECPRFGKWLGCKFEPRYDLGVPSQALEFSGSAAGIIMLADALKPKTYVRDVCVRCGKVIAR